MAEEEKKMQTMVGFATSFVVYAVATIELHIYISFSWILELYEKRKCQQRRPTKNIHASWNDEIEIVNNLLQNIFTKDSCTI